MDECAHRAGVVALLGRPNTGKSTLFNRLLGEKLAIVTPKPQTTRSRLLGILSRNDAQLLLHDTPGLHPSGKLLNEAMNALVDEAARDCDVAALLVDPTQGWGAAEEALAKAFDGRAEHLLVIQTKADLPAARPAPGPPEGAEVLRVSAKTGEGIDELLAAIVARLPESPPYFPEDETTDRTLRFLAGEIVREAAFLELEQELPYSLAVEVVSFDESRPDLVTIRANLIVVRSSQKKIVVGSGGAQIKRIGVRARREIEKLVGSKVYLELWVKVEPSWLKRRKRIESLGYR